MTALEVFKLDKGGCVIVTPDAVIQHGVPPETIKDSMGSSHGVPDTYLAGDQLFDPRTGVCTFELEFPAYFNFFALKKRTRVLCSLETGQRIREIFATAVFGPRRLEPSLEPGLSDVLAEMRYFRGSPFGTQNLLHIDQFLEFIHPDNSGAFHIGTTTITPAEGLWNIRSGTATAKITADVPLPLEDKTCTDNCPAFTPPAFGVTIIGSGHGFDKSSKTCGFIIWGNQRGVLVDPPIHTTQWLKEFGLSHIKIDSLILTHCHADHDAGTLQKILEEQRIALYTTRAVYEAFLVKGMAMTNMPRESFEKLYDFHAVRVQEPTFIDGIEFRFRWSLHSVPTIGFEAFYGGQSFVYTSDHLFDWVTLNDLYQKCLISQDRYTELQKFPWHHPLIFHEAGVPPLHTPLANLEMLPDAVKSRIRLLHVSESQIKPDSLLRIAKPGLDDTIVLEQELSANDRSVKLLDLIGRAPLFQGFDIRKASELLSLVRFQQFSKGEKIISRGSANKDFFFILAGQASVKVQSDQSSYDKLYSEGDYFGETAIILDIPRTADVFAHTDLDCALLTEHAFLYWIRGSSVTETVRRLHQNRLGSSWELMMMNPLLRHLSATQKTHLQSLMRQHVIMPGQPLFRDSELRGCGLIEFGKILMKGKIGSRKWERQLLRGDLVCDPHILKSESEVNIETSVTEQTAVWWVPKDSCLEFLNDHPGIAMRLSLELGLAGPPANSDVNPEYHP